VNYLPEGKNAGFTEVCGEDGGIFHGARAEEKNHVGTKRKE